MDLSTIVEDTTGSRFRVDGRLIGRTRESLLDGRLFKEMILFPSLDFVGGSASLTQRYHVAPTPWSVHISAQFTVVS